MRFLITFVLLLIGLTTPAHAQRVLTVDQFKTSDFSTIWYPPAVSGTLATVSGTETFTNKTVSGPLTFVQTTTPVSPASGETAIYAKSDGFFYYLNATGAEQQIGSGGGGGGTGTVSAVTGTSPIVITGTASEPNVTLTSGGVASGTYTKVGVNEFGLISSGTSLVESDIPSLQTTKITSGIFGIARGGTGLGTVGASGTVLTSNGTDLVYAASTGGSGVVESVSATSPLSITGTVSNPIVNFTGVLPIANGGTNLSTVGSSNTVLTSNGSSLVYAPVFATASPIVTSTTSVSVTYPSNVNFLKVEAASTITLLPAASYTATLTIKKNLATSAVVFIQTSSGELIDSVSASTSLVNYGESVTLVPVSGGFVYANDDARNRKFGMNWGGVSEYVPCGANPCTSYYNTGAVSDMFYAGSTGAYQLRLIPQTCRSKPACTVITADNVNYQSAIPGNTTSTTAYAFNTGTGAANNGWGSILCSCSRW